jgi:hypothetical protein
MDLLYPCKTCSHHFEDHVGGLICAICWADHKCQFRAWQPTMDTCDKFIGDNLKYLEEKHAER